MCFFIIHTVYKNKNYLINIDTIQTHTLLIHFEDKPNGNAIYATQLLLAAETLSTRLSFLILCVSFIICEPLSK